MASVRILHASDLHIAAVPNITSPVDCRTPGNIIDAVTNRMLASSYDPAILQRFADFVHDQASKALVDAVLLTGDIATTGSTRDLEKAFDFIHAPADPRLRSQSTNKEATLHGIAPIWLLPGNHDRYQHSYIHGYVPGGGEFDQVFNSKWRGPVKRLGSIPKLGLTVTVIAADLSLKEYKHHDGGFGWLAQGKAYPEILDELEAETKPLTVSAGHCVIWAVHFPPDYPNISHDLDLLDGDLLVLRANKCGVRAVLAGHTHDPVSYRRPAMKFDVFCAGTVSQAFADPGGNHFRVIEINSDDTGNVIINSEEYLFSKVTGGIIRNRSGFRRV